MHPYNDVLFSVPGPPDPEIIVLQLEALCLANAKWYLQQWAVGEDPPCCADCAGILHREPPRRFAPTYAGAPLILARTDGPGGRPTASCAEIVCMDVGAGIAKMHRDQFVPLLDCFQYYGVVVERTDPTNHSYHAMLRSPEGVEDVTADMEKA